MKKIFVLTGEPSGDKLASTIISRLKLEQHKDFVFSGLQVVKPKLLQKKNKKKFSMREIFFSNIKKKYTELMIKMSGIILVNQMI